MRERALFFFVSRGEVYLTSRGYVYDMLRQTEIKVLGTVQTNVTLTSHEKNTIILYTRIKI